MKHTIYLLLILLSFAICSCGGDKDDSEVSTSGNDSEKMAWVGDYYSDGEKIGVILSFDSGNSGKLRLLYNGDLKFYGFSYSSDGDSRYINFNGGDMSTASMTINGSSATYYSSDGVCSLGLQSLKSFYQSWYDSIVSKVAEDYQIYLSGDKRMPELYLMSAQANQKKLKYIRSTAESEGISIKQSEWETKNLI